MESIGLADMPFVEAKHPMGMLSLPEIRSRADETFNDIVEKAIRRVIAL